MEYLGCVFIILFGTVGHFLFEAFKHAKVAGIFFAVNESTWEHIKLSIYPSLIWFGVEIAVRGFSNSLVVAQAAGLLAMVILIPGLFYGYTAITKKNWLVCDILCFVVAIVLGMWIFSIVLGLQIESLTATIISWVVLGVITVAYFTLTYHAPHNFLFKDPVSGGYGPKGHGCHEHFHHTSDCGCK